MTKKLTKSPGTIPCTFFDFPLVTNLHSLDADIAILGIPYGMPYEPSAMANDQSRAPDAIRQATSLSDIKYAKTHFDWDIGGSLLNGRDIKIVDCGNVTADMTDHKAHYRRAEQVTRKIFGTNTILITLGGDHGISIPVMRALEVYETPITLVHVDAHLDWRHEVNGETEGYSSPIRRASQMPWIDKIVQIGMRGIGSARTGEVQDALAYGSDIISAYDMHDVGMDAVLDRIPGDGPYYLTIDADGIDPAIMPAVIAQTPGGLTWVQIRKLIHGLVKKGRVLGMDLVEIAPKYDIGNISMIHAERLICNFIGSSVRAGYYG
ncbi:MAG: arginase [Deltaproteobacteria bacterium]|nr:MAG: arginase [Deltaproteobacteria bacterium]RLC24026.1 MAG: arginase [Deltaproteobacteria bacterium]